MAGRDITEGRATRAIAVDVGVVSSDAIWQNTNEAYDIAIGGQPFFYAMNDQRPYVRQTAPFRKDQFDNSTEPGEQSLYGWWIRSQSSFHNGSGIVFYDPSAGEMVDYRFTDSKNVDVWTKGEVTMLNATDIGHVTTHPVESNGRSFQQLRSIQWTTSGTTYDGVLLHDGYDVDKIEKTGVLDLQIVEDHLNLDLEDDADIVDEAEDTLTIMRKFVAQYLPETEQNMAKDLNNLLTELYQEALSAEREA